MTFNFTSEGGQTSGFGIAGFQGAQSPSNPSFSTQVGAGVVVMAGDGAFGDGGGGYSIMVANNTSGGTVSLALPPSNTVPGGQVFTFINASVAGTPNHVQVRDSGGTAVGVLVQAPGAGGDLSQGASFLNFDTTGANRWIQIYSPF